MTIPGKCFDGWPIRQDYQHTPDPSPLVRSKKCHDLHIKQWEGRELAIAIRQSLKDRGIEISDERYELIAEACEKE